MIENFLSKRLLVILFLGILGFSAYYLVESYFFNLNGLYRAHNHFKEFLYLLKNSPSYSGRYLDEKLIRELVNRYHLKLRGISKLQNRYLIEIEEIPPSKFVRFLSNLEKYGNVVSFEAVDNTGKGKFYLKLEVAPKRF